ncbi:MAG: hypothetical protein N2489_00950 [Clostridia bacterium]|nr:hypothetical protein [Clostridia bacterium]
MTETFVYESYYIALFHFISLFLIVFINTVIYLKAKKGSLLSSFFVLQAILAHWIIAKILKTFAPDANLKFFFVACQYAGVCFLGPAFIIFASIFATGVKPCRKIIQPLLISSAIFFIIIITNSIHYLFYSSFDFWGDSFGPLFYLYQGYSFLLFIIGILLCVKKFFSGLIEKRIQTLFFTIAIAIPLIANILYVFRFFKKIFGFSPPFDITPMSASASLVLLAFATFKLDFFDNLKIARKSALANIPEGILLAKGDRIAAFNETFKQMKLSGKLSPCSEESMEKGFCKQAFSPFEKLSADFDTSTEHDFTYKTQGGLHIRVICRPVAHKFYRGAYICFVDVTAKQAIIKDLQKKNDKLQSANHQLKLQAEIKKRLVVARTRNYIAQEAHDILGHSIMLAISLLEIARLSNDESQAMEYISRAKKIIINSLMELNMVASAENNCPSKSQGIFERLEKLADEFRTAFVAVEISSSGLMPELDGLIADTIFKVAREGITNALRHGKASRVDIILRNKNQIIELYIIDNGSGCGTFQKGMGIFGMEQRICVLKGKFNCHSLDGQGFCIQASIPLCQAVK